MLQNHLRYLLQHSDVCFEMPKDGCYIEVKDAAKHQSLAWVKAYNREAVEDVITRSQTAQTTWKAQTALQRADILWNWYKLIIDNQEHLAQILTAEQGKPLAEARGEIAYAWLRITQISAANTG